MLESFAELFSLFVALIFKEKLDAILSSLRILTFSLIFISLSAKFFSYVNSSKNAVWTRGFISSEDIDSFVDSIKFKFLTLAYLVLFSLFLIIFSWLFWFIDVFSDNANPNSLYDIWLKIFELDLSFILL